MSATTSAAIRFLNLHRIRNRLASTGSRSYPRRQFLCFLSYSLAPFASSFSESSSEKVPDPLPGVWPALRMEGLWTMTSIEKNKELIDHLRNYGVIKSKEVSEVMETIDRGLFVPGHNPPYSDSPMPIGYNATISAPHMHATCLELLKDHLMPGMRALDVGSDGRLGWPELASYDAIHVGAAASEIPKALLDQLKPGGRMVIPIGNIFQDLKVVDKNLEGEVTMRAETSVRYVPLTSRAAQLQEF